MTPRKKKIRDMSPEEVEKLTDREAMEKIFGKRAVKKLDEVLEEADKQPSKPPKRKSKKSSDSHK